MTMLYHSAKSCFLAVITGVLIGTLPSTGVATDAPITFDRLSLSEGLSQSNIFAMTQDRDGYLWIGTENAADRFDGYQIRSLRFDPNDPQSLTRGSVTSLHTGPLGQLWITTEYGISRFDLDTQETQRILETDARPTQPLFSILSGTREFCQDQIISIFSDVAWRIDPVNQQVHPIDFINRSSDGLIGSMVRDRDGETWLSDGDHLWNSNCQDYSFYHNSSRASNSASNRFGLSLLAITPLGHVAWAGMDGVRLIDPVSGQWLATIKPSEYGEPDDNVLAIGSDSIGGLWLLTPHALVRVVLDDDGLKPRKWEDQLKHEIDLDPLETRPALHIATSGDGLIWVSVANILGAYRPNEQTFQTFRHDPFDPKSLPPTVGWNGYDLLVDDFGVLWIGSKLGGLARYIPERHRFTHIRNLSHASYVVRGIGKQRIDQQRYLWVGLDDRGIELWRANIDQSFGRIPFSTTTNGHEVDIDRLRIRSMATHPITGDVWFNSVQYLGFADAEDPVVTIHSAHTEEFARQRPLAFSPDGRFLYQGMGQVVVQHEFSPTGEWLGARPLNWLSEKMNFFRLTAIHVLNNGIVLISAEDELFAVKPWDQTVYSIELTPPPNASTEALLESISGNRVLSMLSLDDDTLWIGTEATGLIETRIQRTEPSIELETTRIWSEQTGLPDVTIYAIAQDNLGRIWVSSNRGLSRIDPVTSQALNFGLDDGLQAYEFNGGVVHQAQDGSLYFGGINGVSSFQPTMINPHPTPPNVHLEAVLINEQPVDWKTPQELQYDENNWVINYTGLHFVAPEHNQFAYQLEGLDLGWVDAGRGRVARYTGLNPGDYRFWLRSANGDGVWSEPKMLFEARIAPPPWLSPMAFVLYALTFLLAVTALIVRARQRRVELQELVKQRTQELQTKNELVLQQSAALQEALNARTLFFANVSHELRTPLTLIDANLQTIRQVLPNHESVDIAQRYLRRLVRLVDQLLDLSKIRLHGVQTAISAWSLDHLLKNTLRAYEGIAKEKAIGLVESIEPEWYTRVDQASVEKILLNLLTNAIKFTPSGGRVTLTLEADPQAGVWLSVADTGPGIPASEQQTIFERFHRVPVQESQRVAGAGLGLALVSEAVNAIGGYLKLESELGAGSKFSVWLPAQHGMPSSIGHALPDGTKELTPVDTDTEIALMEGQKAQPEATSETSSGKMGTLLVVEDNKDLRDHLASLLEAAWVVYTAADGIEALASLEAHDVDVVLSDIMMPRLDGLGLLEKVRDDLSTSHIPFLFLTARGDDETELKSLMLAADDFLRKPFDPQVLELKLKNVLLNRKRLQAHLEQVPKGVEGPPEHTDQTESAFEATVPHQNLSPRDHRFLERLSHWMASHYAEPDLTVANLADAMAVDERTLQRKTRALFGQTPAYFINEYRIRQSCEALANPTLEIQEVAYQCGYNNPRHFSRVFTKHRGQSPTEWRKNHKK